ncbi:MAG: aldo/keto reductase [Cyclobacteriaceae bacterium]
MKLTRREFLNTVTAGAGTLLIGHQALAKSGSFNPQSTSAYQTVTLGKSGIETTLLGMGTGFNGGNRSSSITRAEKGHAEAIIRYAHERGIRFFDCADIYGTHPHTMRALKTIPRNDYVICSKIWVRSGSLPEPERPDADVVVDRFRKELDTDYIDLMQIHCMVDPEWTDQQKQQMDILENLKSKGIIRAHGVSVHSLEAMEACVESDWVDVVHVRINAFGDAMDRKNPAEVIPVIEKLHRAGKGVIGMKLVGNGNFKNDPGKIDQSLKYALGLGTIDTIIVGFEEFAQIDNFANRLENSLKETRKG